jgi:AraC family transcriptional regulator, transcriptional activator of pobA
LLHILLAQVQRCIDIETEKPISKKYLIIFKQFKNLLDKHFAENKTTSFFAQQLNITAHHLNLITKEVTGKTASEVIRARSIQTAQFQKLLLNSIIPTVLTSLKPLRRKQTNRQ